MPAAGAEGSVPGVVIRPLETWDELGACVDLQRLVWGDDPRELVPPIVLEVTRRAGGVLGGAFDADGRLLGFVYGMPALRDGRLAHWSHLLAVRPEARRQGVGVALKRWQRDRLREAGIDRAYWTYDPLLAANAHLNLNVLGARAVEYVVDFYGREIAAGAGSDRLIVEWDLKGAPAAPAEPAEELLGLESDALPALPRLGVAVPGDFGRLAGDDPPAALRWRERTRRAFTHYLGAGYRVAGFRREAPPHYVLETTG